MSSVTFDAVTKRFGDTVAVDALDLPIADGEFMVLLGPSGCGKTTALRLVAGLDTITSGTLSIGEAVVNDVEPKDRNVSMVFQSYALYPHMTVAKNIESPLVARTFVDADGRPTKLPADVRKKRVDDAAATLGLTGLLDRKPAALSGGQRQRVALARAIVSRPLVFLMDEPLSNLDAKLRAQTRLELVDLHRDLATTVIYVTHDQVEAMTMATRIAVIKDGQLQQAGPPQQVYDQPDNLFVARFIGSPPMNTFAGVVAHGDSGSSVAIGDAGAFALDPRPREAADGSPVVAGVRPEHLHLVPLDHPGVAATITMVEWLGHERHLICNVGGDTVILREPAEGPSPRAGEKLRLRADPAHVHLFDVASERRIS